MVLKFDSLCYMRFGYKRNSAGIYLVVCFNKAWKLIIPHVYNSMNEMIKTTTNNNDGKKRKAIKTDVR